MGKLFLAIILASLSFASCKKEEASEPTKAAYVISGLSDCTMQKQQNGPAMPAIIGLTFTYEHSEQERVVLSVENLPAGLQAKFSSTSGIPSFSSSLQLIDSGVAIGEYTLRLVANGSISGKKSFDFNLSVLAAPDCARFITGTGYFAQSSCSPSGTYTQDIVPVAGVPGRAMFTNFDGTGAQVYGSVSCNTNQISIPVQTVNGVTYQGGGSYQMQGPQPIIYLSINRTTSSGTNYCNITLTK